MFLMPLLPHAGGKLAMSTQILCCSRVRQQNICYFIFSSSSKSLKFRLFKCGICGNVYQINLIFWKECIGWRKTADSSWSYVTSDQMSLQVIMWLTVWESRLISPTGQHLVNRLSRCYSSQLTPRRQLHLIFPAQLSSNGTSVSSLKLGFLIPTSLTIRHRHRNMDELPSCFGINWQFKMIFWCTL